MLTALYEVERFGMYLEHNRLPANFQIHLIEQSGGAQGQGRFPDLEFVGVGTGLETPR